MTNDKTVKFSEKWLREFVDPPISTEQLADQLTMGGLEVESVMPVAPEFSQVLVGKILDAQSHPKAGNLKVCKVDVGSDTTLTVVCGALNAEEGLVAPVARVGSELPGGKRIERVTVRGVDSGGMLCSATELGLAESADGLMVLPGDAPIGHDLRTYLDLDDTCIEVDLTPNRGDCLSVYGIARDVGVFNRCDVKEPVITPVAPQRDDRLEVEIIAPDGCPHYVGRVIRDIDCSAVTPIWMQERLRRGGSRPIHPVVDITNYVMLELGQPMHAFDLDKLHGHVQVRYASEGETVTLLDGGEVELSSSTLVIADQDRAIALAGIMGGQATAVDADTRHIFLESAFFSPVVMAGKARQYRLATDSSHRFERGVDFDLQLRAVERATQFLMDICGGVPGEITRRHHDQELPERLSISLRRSRIKRVLGCMAPDRQVTESLQRLGLQAEQEDDGWRVIAPSYRFDLAIEADLIEEIARVQGYDQIPSHRPLAGLSVDDVPESKVTLPRIRDALIDRGYQEVITYSFVEPRMQERFDSMDRTIPLSNPISSEMAVMRTSMAPGLLQALQYNRHRQQDRVRLFETGLVFSRGNGDIKQKAMIGGIVCGDVYPEQWGLKNREVDFHDVKGDMQALMLCSGLGDLVFEPVKVDGLHPGQTASIKRNGMDIGILGSVYPGIVRDLGLDGRVFTFQLDLSAISGASLPCFTPLPKFPTVRRDLSIVLDQGVAVSQVLDCVAEHAPEELKDLQLFDVYQGKGIDSGEKSLGLGLIFQGVSRTLIDEDVDNYVEKILSGLMQRFAAKLRE